MSEAQNIRVTKGPTAIGDLVDLDHLRQSYAEIQAKQAQAAAEVDAERVAAWSRLTAAEKCERRRGFLVSLGVEDDVAVAASRHGIGAAGEDKTEATRAVARWTAGDSARTFLGLCGFAGVGKTYAAARWCLWASGEAGVVPTRDIVWVKARPDLQELDMFSDSATLRKWARARFVVLDDLGSEYADKGGMFVNKLEGIVIPRHGSGLKTLITSNILTISQLNERYGARVMDRIGDKSWVVLQEKRSRRA